MLVKRFALLSTISYHNQVNYNIDNNNNSNTSYGSNKTQTTTVDPSIEREPKSKVANSNKTTLIMVKQQQQQQHQQQQQEQKSQHISEPILLDNATTTKTTILETTFSSTHLLAQPINTAKTITTTIINHHKHHRLGVKKSDDPLRDLGGDDAWNYSNESDESSSDTGHISRPERPPSNTYTSTTYYGSGFGVFHQQNVRSNGGGIALISGGGSSGGGSYYSGINNNVNLLLGGAMLTLITTILCVVCYCCHRNIKKRTEAAYRQQRQWLESDPNMEIYSVEQCYETSGLFVGDSMDGLATIPALHHEPPPSYDAVVAMQEQQQLLLQQHQQQLLMHQQQMPNTNSPPPGYRSSLDVSSIIPQARGGTSLGSGLTIGGSVMSGSEINSLASSSANLRIRNSISFEDPLLNCNDVNGNVATVGSVVPTTATPTNNDSSSAYLRHKQQRAIAANQISQLNMKKVLQAQSCCSLQRAEVENMWNAAAAALAARSAHLPSNATASTAACVSSPTLAMTSRKPLQIYKNSNSNTPETFGSRYLKQNYYRRGCPLCGKFRYDDSNISISVESNLDSLTGALTEEVSADGQEDDSASVHNNRANGEVTNRSDSMRRIAEQENPAIDEDNNGNDATSDDEVSNNNSEMRIAEQCSCGHIEQSVEVHSDCATNSHQALNYQRSGGEEAAGQIEETLFAAADGNANTASLVAARHSTNQTASNNNTDIASNESPSISATADTLLPRSPAATGATTATAASTVSTPSTTIDLDCINENGIISLDMSKIIDKTGLPTYDAALKLESSGYV